ncbi:MAG: hypothetical protein H0T51_20700 [Pirellulales bacterium]|nr:hypothetical protein [Pirellulales bacterium]
MVTEPAAVTQEQAELWKKDGFDAFVLVLDERFEPAAYQKAAAIVAANSARLYYWIEVGRNKDFARDHPEWMASLGSHDDWRNAFPDAPRLNNGEVAKAWPWIPIAYQKAFDAHLARIKELLGRVPKDYQGLLLNDLQGGPSSCGCGNLQCRWAIDYGVPATTERIAGHDAAATFIAAVRRLAGPKEIIPVWTTECDREDMALEKQPKHDWTTGYCGGVDCYNYCLARFSEQWLALHKEHQGPTAVLLLQKEFLRDRKEYGSPAGWITHAVEYLGQKNLKSVPRERLWLVVQGDGVSAEEEKIARAAAMKTGAGAVLVTRVPIEQSYEPRVIPVKQD